MNGGFTMTTQAHVIDRFINESLRNKSESTRKAYRYSLDRFLAYLNGSDGDITRLTRIDVQSYLSYMQTVKSASASSVQREYAAIAAFCRYTAQEKALADIRLPQAQRTLDIAPKSLEKNERNRLLRDVERDGNLRNTALIYTLIYTGIRVGELVALNIRDITLGDRTESSVMIIRSGKGDKERRVLIPVEARRYLREYLAQRTDRNEALFVAEKGAPERLSVRAVQKLLAKYEVHPHLLRHTLAKTLVDAGTDLPTVAQVLGHNDINVTRRYTKPTLKDVAKALDKAFL
jgi:integrase/recombinase XerD